jgi:hypothetical protein
MTKLLIGHEQARLFTKPLRELTPETSKGFAVIAFAVMLGIELMPWQRWLLIHALELNPDGTYRFRTVLVLVARQNGKTTICKLLALWRMVETDAPAVVLGSSTTTEYAREAWSATVDLAEDHDEAHGTDWVKSVKRGALDTSLTLTNKSRYKVATAGRRGGRSLSVDLGIADELREHQTWLAWSAMSGTTTARPDPQLWALSNAGDVTSVVLNHFRAAGLAFIETGEGDGTLGMFEWSAPEDCELDDREAWAQANPALGHTITEATLEAKSKLPPEVFRTEHLCQNVESGNPAISGPGWRDCADPAPMGEALRAKVVLAVDVAPDMAHVSLVAAAALDDGRVRVEVVAAWESTEKARRELPALLTRIEPRAVGWYPSGPAASLAVDLRKIRGSVELSAADLPQVCQGLAEQVEARRLLHSDDPLLTAQVLGATKTAAADGWRFARRGVGHVDAVYAAAAAVHLARTLPPPKSPVAVV